MITPPAPIIVGFVADIMFTTRIGGAARYAGFQMKWIEEGQDEASMEALGEKLNGRTGELFSQIVDWQPALLLFDLDNANIPWQRWIPAFKTSPATRRVPILCFGSHMNVEQMTRAKEVGSDLVLARSRFTANMAGLFKEHAKLPDHDALRTACQSPLPVQARRGIALFNEGKYYECHDDLEEVWREETAPGRDLFRGILQVGIALHQIRKNNYRGAAKMLLRVRQWLDPLPPVCRSVDIRSLRENIQEIHTAVLDLGAENLTDFDWNIVKRIEIGD